MGPNFGVSERGFTECWAGFGPNCHATGPYDFGIVWSVDVRIQSTQSAALVVNQGDCAETGYIAPEVAHRGR